MNMVMHSTDADRMQDIPDGLTIENWKAMLGVFVATDFQEKSEINAKCREHLQMISSMGSQAFAQVEYKMMDPETGDMPLTSDLWMAQHGFTMKEGKKKWHDSKSEDLFIQSLLLNYKLQ